MSDKLETLLIDAIEKTQAGIGEAVDFAVTQAPEVIEQLLMWKVVSSLIVWSICILIMIAILYFWYYVFFKAERPKEKSHKTAFWYWWYHEDAPTVDVGVAVGGGAFSFLMFVVSFCLWAHNFTWLKIWIAPKLYLLEYAAALVK